MVTVKPWNEEDSRKPNCIDVHAYPQPTDETVTLVTVTASAQTAADAVRWVNVVDREPMSLEEGMDRAREYAERSGIDLILWRDDS